jgi:hypothetical protein
MWPASRHLAKATSIFDLARHVGLLLGQPRSTAGRNDPQLPKNSLLTH